MGLDMPTRAGVYMRQSHEQNINNQAENLLFQSIIDAKHFLETKKVWQYITSWMMSWTIHHYSKWRENEKDIE